jgi:hypothetical protein
MTEGDSVTATTVSDCIITGATFVVPFVEDIRERKDPSVFNENASAAGLAGAAGSPAPTDADCEAEYLPASVMNMSLRPLTREIEWELLPPYLRRRLRSAGIFSIEKLASVSFIDLAEIRGLGKKGLRTAERYLLGKGIIPFFSMKPE